MLQPEDINHGRPISKKNQKHKALSWKKWKSWSQIHWISVACPKCLKCLWLPTVGRCLCGVVGLMSEIQESIQTTKINKQSMMKLQRKAWRKTHYQFKKEWENLLIRDRNLSTTKYAESRRYGFIPARSWLGSNLRFMPWDAAILCSILVLNVSDCILAKSTKSRLKQLERHLLDAN